MQVNFQTSKVPQTTFGMARLTQKGENAAKRFITKNLTDFTDQAPYTTKNILKKMLSANTSTNIIEDFFSYSTTTFGDKNAQFIKKQLTPLSARRKIKSFLEREHSIAAQKFLQENKKPASSTLLTDKGNVLVNSILETFDTNLNNEYVSRSSGKKMLDTIKKYITTEEHVPRTAIMTDKLYTKRWPKV